MTSPGLDRFFPISREEIRHPHFTRVFSRIEMNVATLSPSDASAIVMLAVMMLGMGVIGTLFLSMRRNVARRDPHVDALLEELEAEEKREAAAAKAVTEAPEPAEPWERKADWWKH